MMGWKVKEVGVTPEKLSGALNFDLVRASASTRAYDVQLLTPNPHQLYNNRRRPFSLSPFSFSSTFDLSDLFS